MMDWCPVCGAPRTMEPYCGVCAMRSRLRRAEEENTRVYMSLPSELREGFGSLDYGQGEPFPKKGTNREKERWALEETKRQLVEVRKDTERMRNARNRLSIDDE